MSHLERVQHRNPAKILNPGNAVVTQVDSIQDFEVLKILNFLQQILVEVETP